MKMNPIDNREEWLNRLKSSLEDYREPVPNDAWRKLERSMDARAGRLSVYRILGGVSAAAAVILLFFVVQPFFSNKVTEIIPSVTVTERIEPQDDTQKENDVFNNSLQNGGQIVKSIAAITEIKEKELDITGDNSDNNNVIDVAVVPDLQQAEGEDSQVSNKVEKEVKKQDNKELTWEEYLRQADKEETKKKRNAGKWLALSVGNNGVGAFDPRVVDLPKTMTRSDLSLDMNVVKDVAAYKPTDIIMPMGVSNIETEYKHKQPISFGVTFGKNISSKFTVETGLVYSLLISDIKNLQKDKTVRQTLHYLGIPIRFNWNFINKPKYAIYTGAGLMIEKCIYGTAGNEKLNIKSVQTSLNFSVGAQYKFNQNVGLYFEPGLCYYLGMNEDGSLLKMSNGALIKSIHSEHPFGFTLQAGLRFSF